MDYILHWDDVMFAAKAGVMRVWQNRRAGRPDRFPNMMPKSALVNWQGDIDGAAAELAASNFLNRRWSAPFRLTPGGDEKDVSDHVQVRATTHGAGHLLVREREEDDDIFVLVIAQKISAQGIHYRFPGFIKGRDAKQPDWLKGGTFWVPQSALTPFSKDSKV